LTEQATLEKIDFSVHTSDMSNKQIVEDLLQRIPDGASLHDIAQEIEFIAAVRQGLAELDRGERIPIEEVERELPSWIIK
jgi:predicted transcriptional regulator